METRLILDTPGTERRKNLRGRKPVPTTLKLLRGNPGHRPPPPNEPIPPDLYPECPKHLGKEARRTWNRTVPVLYDMGVVKEINVAVLARYCEGNGQWVELKRELATIKSPETEKKGLTPRAEQYRIQHTRWKKATSETAKGLLKPGDDGEFILNPYLKIEQAAYGLMSSIEKDIDFELRCVREQMRRDEIELGMTPSSQVRVKAEPRTLKEGEDLKGRFFK